MGINDMCSYHRIPENLHLFIYYCGPDNSASCDPHLFSIPPTLQESSKVGDEHFGEVFIQNVFGDFAGT